MFIDANGAGHVFEQHWKKCFCSCRSSVSSEAMFLSTECATAITSTRNYVYVACGPGLVHVYKYSQDADKKDKSKGTHRLTNTSTAGDTEYYHRVKEIRIPVDPNMSTDTGVSSNQLITQLSVRKNELHFQTNF